MSLDKRNVIPVDTHVWQIAVRDYRFRYEGKVPKNISSAVYKAVGKHFFDLFGEYSGWAHTVLFVADLRTVEGVTKADPGSTSHDVVVKVEEEAVESSIILAAAIEQDNTTFKRSIKRNKTGEKAEAQGQILSLEEEAGTVSQGIREIKLEEDSDGRRRSKRSRRAKD